MLEVFLLPLAASAVLYFAALVRIRTGTSILTPVLGWFIGLGIFVHFPLVLLVLSEQYALPDWMGVMGKWRSLDLGSGVFDYSVFVTLVTLCFSSIVILFSPRLNRRGNDAAKTPIAATLNIRFLKGLMIATICVSLVDWGILVALTSAGNLAEFFLSNWYTRQEDLILQFGQIYLLYLRLEAVNQIFFVATFSLYCCLGIRTRGDIPLVVLGGIILVIGAVMTGNRVFIVLFFVGFTAACWIYGKSKMLYATLAMGIVFVPVLIVWAVIRSSLNRPIEALEEHADILVSFLGNFTHALLAATEGTNIILLVNIIKDFGERFDYLYGVTILKLFTFFVPRSLYPEKSDNFPQITANLYEPGEATSLNSTVLGELYANFGPFTVLICPAVTYALLCWSAQVSKNSYSYALTGTTSFLLFLWLARAAISDNLLLLALCLLLIWVFDLEKHLYRSTRTDKLRHSGI